ncbi:hypothetical protein IFR05_004369 [Cadophora sp. M221]|nr:hypothetical protein IFR05_004369 [Cadophora sp. M221]
MAFSNTTNTTTIQSNSHNDSNKHLATKMVSGGSEQFVNLGVPTTTNGRFLGRRNPFSLPLAPTPRPFKLGGLFSPAERNRHPVSVPSSSLAVCCSANSSNRALHTPYSIYHLQPRIIKPQLQISASHTMSPHTPANVWGHEPASSSSQAQSQNANILQKANWRSASSSTPVSAPNLSPASNVATLEDITQGNFQYNSDIPHHVREVDTKIAELKIQKMQLNGLSTTMSFRPSHAAMEATGLLAELGLTYSADKNNSSKRSANIREEENCSLWITGLPVNLTYRELLLSIRNVGKIMATVIKPPLNHFTGCAAKIVFFERQSAEKLFQLITAGRIHVMGQPVPRVCWNSVLAGRYPNPEQSRAIRITGPKELMNFQWFELYFKMKFTYDLDRRGEVECALPGMVSHEWHFGSLRSQAKSAKRTIELEYPGIFSVEWARDPCS